MNAMKESTGMSVLKPLALEKLKDETKKNRIWSNQLESWGFFGVDTFSEEDAFLLYCGITIGDRLCVSSANGVREICTLVGIWKEKNDSIPTWKYRLLQPDGSYFDLKVRESLLFKQAWG